MEHYLVFNGKMSGEYGVWISGSGVFNAPERDISTLTIPGRNGTLTLDNGRYKNISVTYPAFIVRDFRKNVDAFRAFLLSGVGYKRLEDTYHPDEFYLARYTGGFSVNPTTRNLSGAFNLNFDRKPQRFLKSGEKVIAVTANTSIKNDTLFPAKPLLRLYGNGSISIGGYQITVTANSAYIDIDCETLETLDASKNQYINFESDKFEIVPGENSIVLSGITRAEIKPRWWTI